MTTSAFSGDGQFLAAASVDGTVRVWNLSAGELLCKRRIPPGDFDGLAFSPDGASLAVINFGKTIRIIATRTGEIIAAPVNTISPLKLVRWSDNPGRILTVDREGIVRLWNVERCAGACKLPSCTEIDLAKISANRRILVVAESTGTIHLFAITQDFHVDVQSGKTVDLGERHIDDIALSDDGSHLAVSAERQVFIRSTRDRKQVAEPLPHSESVKQIRFAPNGAWLISVSEGGHAALWDVATGRPLYEPLAVGENAVDLDVDREGKHCALATRKRITIWELASGRRAELRTEGGNFRFARFLNEHNKALVARFRRPLELFDIDSGRPVPSFNSSLYPKCLALSDDKRVFLMGSQDGTVRLWNTENGVSASPLFDFPSAAQAAFVDLVGNWAATHTENSHFVLWDAKTAELLSSINIPALWPTLFDRARLGSRPIRLVSFSLDNRSLCLITSGGVLVRLNLDVDQRNLDDMRAEIALRSGVVPDGSEGLQILSSEELAALWASIARKMADPISASSRFEASDFGQESKAAFSTMQVPVR